MVDTVVDTEVGTVVAVGTAVVVGTVEVVGIVVVVGTEEVVGIVVGGIVVGGTEVVGTGVEGTVVGGTVVGGTGVALNSPYYNTYRQQSHLQIFLMSLIVFLRLILEGSVPGRRRLR